MAVQLCQYRPSQRCKKPLGYACSLTSEEQKRRGNCKSRNEVRQSRRAHPYATWRLSKLTRRPAAMKSVKSVKSVVPPFARTDINFRRPSLPIRFSSVCCCCTERLRNGLCIITNLVQQRHALPGLRRSTQHRRAQLHANEIYM